ncbi:MAG: GntR family transcriptional regulator [Spirochaetia bacterium]|nr:GntR family transcriptional regulator [Spirochaetia bacterium]
MKNVKCKKNRELASMSTDNNTPKYVKIINWLEEQIKEGSISVGGRLPTEESIAEKFGINRMTVRQAIDDFVVRKMVVRRRGHGSTLVRNTPVEYIWQFNNILSFTESMENSGIRAHTKSNKTEIIEASQKTAKLLDLAYGSKVLHTLRTKYAEDEPVCIESSYLPYDRFSRLKDLEIKGSLYRTLTEEFNTHLVKSTQYLSSVFSDKEEMKIFGFSKPQPCMMVESLSFDSDGNPVEVLYSCFRGDRYRFRIESGEYKYQKKQDRM